MNESTQQMQARQSRLVRDCRIPPERLRWSCDPADLPFETTEAVQPLDGTIGQERAVMALTFSLEMRTPGFHLFAAGPPGTGRTTTTRLHVEKLARIQPTPPDWCYVHNFDNPDRPLPISLPAGQAGQFRHDMANLVAAARRELRRVLESREYRRQLEQTHRPIEEERERLLQTLSARAEQQGFALTMTPAGPAAVPMMGRRPMTPEELASLPEEQRRRLEERGEQIIEEMRDALTRVQRLERETHERMARQEREAARAAIEPLIRQYQAKYRDLERVVQYLARVQEDIAEHVDAFRAEAPPTPDDEATPQHHVLIELERISREQFFDRYNVNVLVDNRAVKGAPVVVEPYPTYYNLLGRIEYRAHLGAITTDFRMIRPGALHRANGGYLVLDAVEVLTQPLAWEALKRTLKSGHIRVENLGEQHAPLPAATLRPEPIPVDVKVVLIGPPLLYYLLYFLDEDFPKLFGVRSDFDTEVARTSEHLARYAAFISRRVREQRLKHFHRSAIAKVAEYGARVAEHQGKLSARLEQLADLVDEASYWADKEQSGYVLDRHVQRAIEQKTYRSSLLEEKIRELIEEGTIFIDTSGSRTGQVNGLSILDLGDYAFGRPVRITAQTALGSDGIVNLERETHLSGRVHSKGFLTLTSFLLGRFAQDKPLALAARLTFEQTYDEIEGDSASCAELYALLSSLSGLPLRQDISVTGSVNQLGQVQPVGGVTRKIEGFFDVCRVRGLTGQQGVIIPASNIRHLMLREDVVEAVRQGSFHVWAVRTIDEGIEILTGVRAGERRPDGRWEDGTVNALVDQRLREYAEHLKTFGRAVAHGEAPERAPAEIGPRAPRVRGWWPRLRHLLTRLRP